MLRADDTIDLLATRRNSLRRPRPGWAHSRSTLKTSMKDERMKTQHEDAAGVQQRQTEHPTVASTPLSLPDAPRIPVPRGITQQLHPKDLAEAITKRTLLLVNRFRVVRTIDIAVHCFPERPFKAALTAAQRTVRRLVKAKLLARYKTERMMTIYGLTQRGVAWLAERELNATASVRRVSDMTNPEHRLWAQFITLCAEARGLEAMSEAELLVRLNSKVKKGGTKTVQGLMSAVLPTKGSSKTFHLRPDAAALEEGQLIWFEIDRSSRGSARAKALTALALSIGSQTALKVPLGKLVLFCSTERVEKRVRATIERLAVDQARIGEFELKRKLRACSDGSWEVFVIRDEKLHDGRIRLVDRLEGHIIVQRLPRWFTKIRLSGASTTADCPGWFGENYLPYRRLHSTGGWSTLTSPLMPGPAISP